MSDLLKKYMADSPEDWREWTLDQLRSMADESNQLDQKAAMLDYTANVFAGIGVKKIAFEDGHEVDTESKVIRFPFKKEQQKDE